jgi:hypothetical protein
MAARQRMHSMGCVFGGKARFRRCEGNRWAQSATHSRQTRSSQASGCMNQARGRVSSHRLVLEPL